MTSQAQPLTQKASIMINPAMFDSWNSYIQLWTFQNIWYFMKSYLLHMAEYSVLNNSRPVSVAIADLYVSEFIMNASSQHVATINFNSPIF